MIKKVVSILFIVFLIISFSNLNLIFSDQEIFSIEEKNIEFKLFENEKVTKKIKIINNKYEDIYFSAYKSNNYEIADSIVLEDNEEELGSYWLTSKQDFQRLSLNNIESIKPPFLRKWSYETEKILHSPVVKGKNIYIPSEDGCIYLLDSRTGVFKDRYSFGSPVFSVNIIGRLLLVQCKDSLNVYDRISKILLWKHYTQNTDLFSVAAYNKTIYLSTGERLISFDESTGSIKWSRAGAYNTVSLSGDNIIATSLNNAISCFNAQNGDSIFQIKLSGEIVGVPSIYEDLIYITCTKSISDKSYTKIFCFDFKGNEIWTYNLFDITTCSQSLSKDYLIIATINGVVYALNRKLTGKNNQLIWKYETKSPIHISPTITDNNVYIGCNNGYIYALDINKGTEMWRDKVKFPVYSEIVVAQGFLYTSDNTGAIFAWGGEWENVVPPMSPEGFNGYPGNSNVTLFWRVSNIDKTLIGYNVYRKANNENEFEFIKKLGYVNNYQDNTIKNDISYNYIIRAYDSYGNESPSSSQLTVMSSRDYEPVWLNFTPTNGMVRAEDTLELEIDINALNIPAGLYSGSIYVVNSANVYNVEPIEISIKVTIQEKVYSKPKPPKFITYEPSDTRVMLNWEKIDNIKSYKLYRATVSKDRYKLLAEIPSTITTYIDDSVENNVNYYYYLKSVNSDNIESEYYDEISIKPNPLPINLNLRNNSIVYDAIFDISGKVDPKAKLLIKGVNVLIDSDGYFVTRVGIPVGLSDLEIKTIDTNNNIQINTVTLNYVTSYLNIELLIDSKTIFVNNKLWPYLFDMGPELIDGRSYVPLRFLSETLGATLEWEPLYKKIIYHKGDTIIELWINKKIIKINGKTIIIDAAPFIKDNKPMVPIRFITEPLGAKVGWDQNTKIISLIFNF